MDKLQLDLQTELLQQVDEITDIISISKRAKRKQAVKKILQQAKSIGHFLQREKSLATVKKEREPVGTEQIAIPSAAGFGYGPQNTCKVGS